MALSRRNWLQLASGLMAAALPRNWMHAEALPARQAAAAAPAPAEAADPAAVYGSSPYPRLPVTFFAHRLTTDHAEACSVMDVNGDGRLDILSGAYWYENPGPAGGPWVRHQFRLVGTLVNQGTPNQERVCDCMEFVLDVNKDGRLDLVTAGWQRDGIWWFENPGPEAIAAGTLWQAHKICHSIDTEGMVLGDLMGTGKNLDVVASHYNNGPHLLWVNFAGPEPVVHEVGASIPRPARGGRAGAGRRGVGGGNANPPSAAARAAYAARAGRRGPVYPPTLGQGDGHGVGIGDVDGDGKNDIITRYGWFKNIDASQNQWEWHPEWEMAEEASYPILAYDVNGDGKNDIIYGAAHTYGLFWLEQVGGGQWTKHLIDDSVSQVHAIVMADIDNDGQPELIAGKRYRADPGNPGDYDPIALHYYKIDRSRARFIRYPITYNGTAGGGMQIVPVDIDNDGDLDLVVAGRTGAHWIENYLNSNVPNSVREKWLLLDNNWPFPGEGNEVTQQNAPVDSDNDINTE